MGDDERILDSFEDEGMARLLAGRLEAEGLSPRLVPYGIGLDQHGMGFHLLVPAEEIARAREIAAHDYSAELDEMPGAGDDDQDACPRCASRGTVSQPPGVITRVLASLAGARPRERRRCATCGARR